MKAESTLRSEARAFLRWRRRRGGKVYDLRGEHRSGSVMNQVRAVDVVMTGSMAMYSRGLMRDFREIIR